jgi:hypothetical protein
VLRIARPNAVCPVCSAPSHEDLDVDGTAHNACADCCSVYVTPPGRPGPTVRYSLEVVAERLPLARL